MKKTHFVVAIIITGFSGLVAQVVLLRELLVAFMGNELTVGIILANWLLLEAAGVYFLGRVIETSGRRVELFVIMQTVFCASLPLCVFAARSLSGLAGARPGEALGLASIFFGTLIILFPVSVTHGALFTFGTRIFSEFGMGPRGQVPPQYNHAFSIGRVYAYETLGTIAGGLAFTYFFAGFLTSFWICVCVFILNTAVSFLILGYHENKDTFRNALRWTLLTITALLIFAIWTGGIDRAQRSSIEMRWPRQNIIAYENSIYGNVAVGERQGQYTFYLNGEPEIIAPVPDVEFTEEFANLSALFDPKPEKALILGSGAGGIISELLKHPFKAIDYVEMDPLIIEMLNRFPTELTKRELSDPRVRVIISDARMHVRMAAAKYDLVLIGISEPSDLQANRLYTVEFYDLAKERLTENGVLALTMPGSSGYINQELSDMNASVINSLRKAFGHTRIIPGDFNLLLASSSKDILKADPKDLFGRLKDRHIGSALLTEDYIGYKLKESWFKWYFAAIENSTKKENHDFLPSAVFYSLSYWNSIFSPATIRIFDWMEAFSLKGFLLGVSLLACILFMMKKTMMKFRMVSVPYCMASSGFAGMIFELILIFAFQVIYGYVYYEVGLLITAFMTGAVAGSVVFTSYPRNSGKVFKVFLSVELCMVILCMIIPSVMETLKGSIGDKWVNAAVHLIFLIISFVSGFVVSSEFPLANRIYLAGSPKVSHTAGLLYGADLLGGWFGGMIGGLVLLPVLGLYGTCMAVAGLKLGSMFLFASSSGDIKG